MKMFRALSALGLLALMAACSYSGDSGLAGRNDIGTNGVSTAHLSSVEQNELRAENSN